MQVLYARVVYRAFFVTHYVYILYSRSRDKYYIGSSADPIGRLVRHNTAAKGYTASGKPWQIVFEEKWPYKTSALKRERQLKRWKNRQRIEALIKRKYS